MENSNDTAVRGEKAPSDTEEKQNAANSLKVETDDNTPTTGEKLFDKITYGGLAWGATLVLSIVIAYVLRDSSLKTPKWLGGDGQKSFKEKYPEWITQLGDWIHKKTGANQKLSHEISNTSLLTTVTFFGGNIPVFPIRWLEQRKKSIVESLNKRYGKEGEVEQGNANVEKEAPQGWGSLLKGRIAAWLIVFVSFFTLSKVIPNTFGGLEKDSENIVKKAGEVIHKWPKGAAQNPNLLDEAAQKLHYRYEKTGNLLALDAIATTASASILYVTSKLFAQKKADTKTLGTQPDKNETKSIAENTPAASSQRDNASERDNNKEATTTEKKWNNNAQRKNEVSPRETSFSHQRRNEVMASEAAESVALV